MPHEYKKEPSHEGQPDPAEGTDAEKLAKVEEDLLERLEKKTELQKLEHQADEEMRPDETESIEHIFLMVAAALMVISLPFMHYLLAIVLTVLMIAISLVAGLTSSKRPSSARLNLFVSIIGLLFFAFSAIYVHSTSGASASFWLYQVLAFIFLFATFFSARTFRKKVLET